MKSFITLFYLLPLSYFAQLNIQQLGYLDVVTLHNSEANDIWGYVDTSGNEYAIVGLQNGVSVVDVTNPTNPVEVFFQPGLNSIWRDIKTWNHHAYITTEAQEGLLILDLSTLPANPNLDTIHYAGPVGSEWQSAHNLYIDENGIAYIFGANRGNGGTIMLDLTIDPMIPLEIGVQDTYYTHDGVTQGDTLYQAHISDGFFTIYDVTNKANPIYLGQQNSPGSFSHNLWFSDDNNYLYTTDEITNGFIGEYDISDPSNIVFLDQIQSSPGSNAIPHNAHFINDYLVTSYYTDGVVIHDVSNKGNMVEVGNFDTSPLFSGDGFNGCWGVYPWLPSGNIISADIENGLHILGPTYTRGCYLEGNVVDSATSMPINNVSIEIIATNVLNYTNLVGDYATGYAVSGVYDIVYSNPSYYSDTVFGVVLSNGVTTLQDAELVLIPPVSVSVNVQDTLNNPVSGGEVVLFNEHFNHTGTLNPTGTLIFGAVVPGVYDLLVGKWGYVTYCGSAVIDSAQMVSVTLENGYYDDFSLDFGWTVSGGAPDGIWERAVPDGTGFQGTWLNPNVDVAFDCLDQAYVTGNGGGSAGDDDVDIAATILTSPVFDLSGYSEGRVDCQIWWRNTGGNGPTNDSLNIYITDGINQQMVKSFIASGDNTNGWELFSFSITDFMPLTNSMQVIFQTADWQAGGGHLVEAGVDVFRVMDSTGSSVSIIENGHQNTKVYPNPSSDEFMVYLEKNRYPTSYAIYSITGKLIDIRKVSSSQFKVNINNPGVYFLQVMDDTGAIETIKLIKK